MDMPVTISRNFIDASISYLVPESVEHHRVETHDQDQRQEVAQHEEASLKHQSQGCSSVISRDTSSYLDTH